MYIDTLTEEQQELVESAAESLYGLIHARFILTTRGMTKMVRAKDIYISKHTSIVGYNFCSIKYDLQQEKYVKADFGRCPRVLCQGQALLPGSISDVPRSNVVHVFCPQCQELYYPRSTKQANLDGAYFGTTFPHLFLLLYPDCIPTKPTLPYVPRIYGFKINSDSSYYKIRYIILLILTHSYLCQKNADNFNVCICHFMPDREGRSKSNSSSTVAPGGASNPTSTRTAWETSVPSTAENSGKKP